jgi:ABC-type molybdate transport system ATPase subunit
MSNGGRFLPELDEKKNQKYDENNNPLYKDFSYEQVQAFTQAQQMAQMQQQQAQMWTQQASQQYGNNVSIWLEAAKAQLEAEQDAALEPLSYQETMWELEKTQAETKLERIKAELESYNNLCKEEIQNSAPKFGLG